MKEDSLNALSRLIRKEVKAAIQEEVRDIIIEAVRIASTPKSTEQPITEPIVVNTPQNISRADIRAKFQTMNPIEQMLEETKLNFTSADAKNFISGEPMNPNKAVAVAHELGMMDVPKSNTGLDLSSLPFLKNAKTILDLSKEKDKLKYGGN